jgi:hypothetical protein
MEEKTKTKLKQFGLIFGLEILYFLTYLLVFMRIDGNTLTGMLVIAGVAAITYNQTVTTNRLLDTIERR